MSDNQNLFTEHNEEWYQRRRKHLGASEVPAVVGVSAYSGPMDVWASKVHDARRPSGQAAMLGHLLQPIIGQLAAEATDLKIAYEERFVISKEAPWASATIDYIGLDDRSNEVIIECKATKDYPYKEIPERFKLQLAWQCFVSGIPRASLSVLHSSTTHRVYGFNFYKDAMEWFPDVLKKCEEFWFNHVVTGIAPQSFMCDEELIRSIQADKGKSVELTENAIEAVYRLKDVRERISQLEEAESALKTTIQGYLMDAEIGTFDGKPVVTWKESTTSRFDSTEFKKIHPDLYKTFAKSSSSRRFLVK